MQTNQEQEMSEQPGDKRPQGTPTGSSVLNKLRKGRIRSLSNVWHDTNCVIVQALIASQSFESL